MFTMLGGALGALSTKDRGKGAAIGLLAGMAADALFVVGIGSIASMDGFKAFAAQTADKPAA